MRSARWRRRTAPASGGPRRSSRAGSRTARDAVPARRTGSRRPSCPRWRPAPAGRWPPRGGPRPADCPGVSASPRTDTVPSSAVYCPLMIFISVDLPAPFSPASAVTVPGSRRSVTPLSIGTPPKLFVIPEHSSSNSTIVTRQSFASSVRIARWHRLCPPTRSADRTRSSTIRAPAVGPVRAR